MSKSKYIGRVFDGWTVCDVVDANGGNHKIFHLSKRIVNSTQCFVIMIRDNEMTRLARGETTMDGIIAGKKFQRDQFKTNMFRNCIYLTAEGSLRGGK